MSMHPTDIVEDDLKALVRYSADKAEKLMAKLRDIKFDTKLIVPKESLQTNSSNPDYLEQLFFWEEKIAAVTVAAAIAPRLFKKVHLRFAYLYNL